LLLSHLVSFNLTFYHQKSS